MLIKQVKPKVLPPALRIHDDALFLIFITVVDLTWYETEGQVGPKAFPFVASHVCSRWRAFSLSEPRLWSYIHISIPFLPKLTKVWHERSFPCSIVFRLTTGFDYSQLQKHIQSRMSSDPESAAIDDEKDFRFCCNQSLIPNLTRYRKIVVCTSMDPRYPFLHFFGAEIVRCFQKCPDPVLSLQSFCFESDDDKLCHSWSPVLDPTIIFPSGAPALVFARIGYPFGFQPHVFANLRLLDIAISRLTVTDFHSIVQQCSALETLIVEGSLHHHDDLDRELQHLSPLDLPNLRTLKFSGGQSQTLLKLAFLFSHTPCRDIEFRAFSWCHVAGFRRYIDHGIRTFANLEVLTVDLRYVEDVTTVEESILVLSDYFPRISVAKFFGITESVFSLFGNAWPELHTLSFLSSISPTFLMDDSTLKVLITRLKAGIPLKKLEVPSKCLQCSKGVNLLFLRRMVELGGV